MNWNGCNQSQNHTNRFRFRFCISVCVCLGRKLSNGNDWKTNLLAVAHSMCVSARASTIAQITHADFELNYTHFMVWQTIIYMYVVAIFILSAFFSFLLLVFDFIARHSHERQCGGSVSLYPLTDTWIHKNSIVIHCHYKRVIMFSDFWFYCCRYCCW